MMVENGHNFVTDNISFSKSIHHVCILPNTQPYNFHQLSFLKYISCFAGIWPGRRDDYLICHLLVAVQIHIKTFT